jgi:hypothetical protein
MRRTAITLVVSLAAVAGLSTVPASASGSPVTAKPGALAFGGVPMGQSVTMEITFTNHGSVPLWFTGWTILPLSVTAFSFDDDFLANDLTSCAYITVNDPPALPAGQSCAAAVTFSPTNAERYRANLVTVFGLFDGDYTYTLEWSLLGRGL